ncbi:phage head closure protein [Caloramator proteoclasticus]|uniref:Phage head-tail adaptor, putative, SPP1 family n=1 Tax=Caloramator proteoclasticus DSM 10124 TaxID=1121262 RepID=A0A1M5C659_9CLOT|nr:phage head closure protein [Caloramator proteoclasticus]SHF50233.1 phage head-tail adaptor, putative, SPP1 family [Caloramator proteoclasticus DSM 10124]
MNIGDMRHRITILKPVKATDDNGFETETYENFKTVWASISNLYGREYFEAATLNAEKTVKFTIRYIDGIDNSMRISFRGKQYEITFIDNIKYENRFIEIRALEVESIG